MMGVDTPKVRLVRCPKCSNLLPEPPGVPIYSCGGCGTFLQAKTKKTSDPGRTTVDPPIDNPITESTKQENNGSSRQEEEDAQHQKSMEAAAVDSSSSISTANIEHPHEGNEAKENGCCSNQIEEEEDTAVMGYISLPHSQPQVEQDQNNTNFGNEVEEEAVAVNVGSDQIVAVSDVSSTSDIEQEAPQINGSAEDTAQETTCQVTASSFAVEEQFQNLDTYVGVRYEEAHKAAGDINESQSQPTRKSRNEQLELLQSGEEIFFISEEERKLREELLLLNHPTPDEDSVSEMLMIKGLNPVIGTHPTRYRSLSESYDQWGPRYGEGPSNREPEKFLHSSSSLHSEQDKTELLRIMVLQLEEQVRRMHHTTSLAETGSSEMKRFYSGTLNRMRNRFSQPYLSSSSGFSSPQQPRRYYPPSSPSWDFETKSVDQLSNNSKFSYQQRERVHVPKRHVRAVAGGAPVVTCYQCSAVLQLPEDFLLSKRKQFHWLKCGSCSTVLRFSLHNGTHIVPYREGGGLEENRKRETEEARRERSSALHKLMGYSSVTQLVIGSGESSPSDQTSV